MESYTLEGTELRLQVHSVDDCNGPPCPIHHKSDHHMREWPQHWRDFRRLMERVCLHGIGHPDPDQDLTDVDLIHGCDGCCTPTEGNSNGS